VNQNRFDEPPPGFAQNYDGNPAVLQILLIADVLVRSNKNLELALGPAQEVSVFDSAPATLLHRTALMAWEEFVHRPGNTLVQQDLHAVAGVNKADSDRSKTRRAISFVTEGKHSKNSSNE